MVERNTSRQFVRTFFTSPTAVEGDDTAKMIRKAGQLSGMEAPDVWVPDNEDATAPSMRDEGVENIIDVVTEYGADFDGQIHPRMVWHRDSPEKRRTGFEHMMRIGESDAIEHIDGFVIPEVGSLDDWKKADEFITMVETANGLEEGSLSMSPIIESGESEIAMSRLDEEIGKRANNLQRLFLLVDGEVDYTKDMRAMTPTGAQPEWKELRHNTSRAASAVGILAVDGPYDDIRDVEGYRQRMTENHAMGMIGIWSLTPGQVVEANTHPLPPVEGSYLIEIDGDERELERTGEDAYRYEGGDVELQENGDGSYTLRVGREEIDLEDEDELNQAIVDRTQSIVSLDDYVDAMEEFEAAKESGKGAISLTRTATLELDGTEVEVSRDRMWDEATYQAAQTPVSLFQDVYESRPDQRDELEEMYGEDIVDRTMQVGN